MSLTAVRSDFEWEKPGRQDGYLETENSVHRSAYGVVYTPLSVFNAGTGPTLLLMAGSHGDEYEGQLALSELIRTIDIAKLRGRLIVMPTANAPAAVAGNRLSPIDQGNLNRLFGQSITAGSTAGMARFISDILFPLADYCFDCHSGGSSMKYLPTIYTDVIGDTVYDTQALDAVKAINAPFAWIGKASESDETSGGIARNNGVVSLAAEYGGGGQVDQNALDTARRSIYRLLAHLDMYPLPDKWKIQIETRWLTGGTDMNVYTKESGVFEPKTELGSVVRRHELAGYIHTPERQNSEPTPIYFPRDGLWICQRTMGRVIRGDCLGHLLVDTELTEFGYPDK